MVYILLRPKMSSSQMVDLVFALFYFSFLYFLFLEQLELELIGHAITPVTNLMA